MNRYALTKRVRAPFPNSCCRRGMPASFETDVSFDARTVIGSDL
jgi:hypothetical protein